MIESLLIKLSHAVNYGHDFLGTLNFLGSLLAELSSDPLKLPHRLKTNIQKAVQMSITVLNTKFFDKG
jgi:hypothetical protein